jgi:uncharacterized tellurite resistance protein B-like protein
MDRLDLFRNLMVMAASDGKFTDEEIDFLAKRAGKLGINDEKFGAAVKYAANPNATLDIPPDEDQRKALLCEMVRMMAVDGNLAEVEKELFAVAAAMMNISTEDLDKILDDLLGKK